MSTVDLNTAFARFVYPFTFDAGTFRERAEAVKDATWPGEARALQVWKAAAFPAEGMLAHVGDFLNSEASEAARHAAPTAQVWEVVNPGTLRSYHGLGAQADWALVVPGGEIPFRFVGIQLAIFGLGVGFLTIQAQPASAALDDWLTFLHHFRYARGRHGVRVRARRHTGRDQTEPYFPPPAGGVASLDGDAGQFSDILAGLLRTANLPGEKGNWWHDVFVPGQMLAYAALFADNVAEDEIPLLLYRVRNFFGPTQGALMPEEASLPGERPEVLPYAARQWFLFSLEGGAFVACDAPAKGFFREQLPGHLRNDYFLLFLIALLQRFALLKLSMEVARDWPLLRDPSDLDARKPAELAFARINTTLLAFMARGYFVQVMQHEHHHRCYQRWQEIFQIERLYQEVSDEVRAMDGQLRLWSADDIETQTRRIESRLSQLALLLGGPGLALAFASALGGVSIDAAVRAAIIGLVFGAIVLAVVTWWERIWRYLRRQLGA